MVHVVTITPNYDDNVNTWPQFLEIGCNDSLSFTDKIENARLFVDDYWFVVALTKTLNFNNQRNFTYGFRELSVTSEA